MFFCQGFLKEKQKNPVPIKGERGFSKEAESLNRYVNKDIIYFIIIFSIGTMTKTAAAYALVTAQKTSLDCGDSPLASSNPKVRAVSRRKCDSSCVTYAWYLTTCG